MVHARTGLLMTHARVPLAPESNLLDRIPSVFSCATAWRAGVAADDGVTMVVLFSQCLDNAANNGYGCGLTMNNVSQVVYLVHCCRCLIILMMILVAVDY